MLAAVIHLSQSMTILTLKYPYAFPPNYFINLSFFFYLRIAAKIILIICRLNHPFYIDNYLRSNSYHFIIIYPNIALEFSKDLLVFLHLKELPLRLHSSSYPKVSAYYLNAAPDYKKPT